MLCASGKLYVLQEDYVVGIVTDPKFVQVVMDTGSEAQFTQNKDFLGNPYEFTGDPNALPECGP